MFIFADTILHVVSMHSPMGSVLKQKAGHDGEHKKTVKIMEGVG